MKKIFNKYKEQITYLIFGVLTTVVNIVVYYISTRMLNLGYKESILLSWLIAVLFAFVTNKFIVFKSKTKHFIKEILYFYFFRILSLIIELLLMYTLVDLMKINDMTSKILVSVVIIAVNYIFSKVFIFKKETGNGEGHIQC